MSWYLRFHFALCFFSNFSRCTPVFLVILVILHTCIFRDARCASEARAREKTREKSRKIARKTRKIAKLPTAHDCSRIARARYARARSRIAKSTGVQALKSRKFAVADCAGIILRGMLMPTRYAYLVGIENKQPEDADAIRQHVPPQFRNSEDEAARDLRPPTLNHVHV